jgi:hypothetical protein
MRERWSAALLTLPLAGAVGMVAAQNAAPPVQNAVQQSRAATSIARDVAVVGGTVEPSWIAWRVPMVPGERDICSTWMDDGRHSRGAVLEGASSGEPPTFDPPARSVALEAATELVVLVRTVGGQAERLRTVTADCPLDAGGRRLTWLTGVTPAASISYLRTLTTPAPADTAARHRLAEAAVGAAALHHDAAALVLLSELLGQTRDTRLRDLAAHWLARARGAEGFERLRDALRTTADPAFRRTLAGAMTQTREPETPAALLALARSDADERVRAEALAGYAQLGAGPVVSDVLAILERDPSAQVRSRGIAGLQRRPARDAVPPLLALVRTTPDLELRKELVRSLSRSDDPRAVALMEELVTR